MFPLCLFWNCFDSFQDAAAPEENVRFHSGERIVYLGPKHYGELAVIATKVTSGKGINI